MGLRPVALITVAAMGGALALAAAPAPRLSQHQIIDLDLRAPTVVPVTEEMLRGGFAAGAWLVRGEQGEPLEARLEHDARGRRSVRLVEVSAGAEGHLITVDLGAARLRHDSLRVVMSRPRLVPGVVLEQSTDARQWSALATATLFRLGSASGLNGAEIRYPPTRSRYLRLHWPKDAGFPEFEAITTRDLDQARQPRTLVRLPGIEQRSPIAGCRVYEISRGRLSATAESLDLAFSPGPRAGVSVLRVEGGAWSEWDAFDLEASADARAMSLSLSTGAMPEWIQVRVCRQTGPAPALESAVLTFEPARVVIDGRGVTRARLEYGPRVPEEVLAPLARLDASYKGAAWFVEAPGAEVGDVVRAAVPDTLLAAAEGRATRLRLLTAEGLLPLEAYHAGPPRRVEGPVIERLTSEDGRWLEAIEFSLGELEVRPTSVEVLLAGASFEQDLTLEFEEQGRLGVEARRHVLDRRQWSCQYRELPCRLTFSSLPLRGVEKMQLTLHQGGIPATVEVQALAWRRGVEVAFVWPGADKSPRLVVTSAAAPLPEAPAPAGFASWVRRAEATPGKVLGRPSGAGEAPSPVSGWLLYLSLAAAAAMLALVIFRALRTPSP